MADLLGSILGSMEKPPGMGDAERKKAREQKARQEKMVQEQKERLNKFKQDIQKRLNEFIKDSSQQKYKFEPMDKTSRALVHEVTEVAGLTSFSFGQDEVDRYVMIWKKEYAPSDDEVLAYRRGEEWTPEIAKELAKQRELDKQQEEEDSKRKPEKIIPVTNYKDKYEHLIGKVAAKDAARMTLANKQYGFGEYRFTNYKDKYEHLIGKVAAKDAAMMTLANKQYGFVSSENKRDRRTIEQVMADNKAKRQKLEHLPEDSESNHPEEPQET